MTPRPDRVEVLMVRVAVAAEFIIAAKYAERVLPNQDTLRLAKIFDGGDKCPIRTARSRPRAGDSRRVSRSPRPRPHSPERGSLSARRRRPLPPRPLPLPSP